MQEHASKIVHDVVKVALDIEKPAVGDLFDYTFAELPPELLRQKQTLRTDSIGQDPAQAGLKPPKETVRAVTAVRSMSETGEACVDPLAG